jgi:hypothetical protein
MGLFDVMAGLPPEVAPGVAEAIAWERWGLEASARVLPGERDRNFQLRAADGRQFVLKFANPAEDAGFRGMQIAALAHIGAADPGLAIPRLVALPKGGHETGVDVGGQVLQARMLSWVEGQPIGEARPGVALWRAYGAVVARLQGALAGFDHPARDHVMVWDLQHAPRLREIAFAIPHAGARGVLLELLDEYEAMVRPVLADLPWQVVHNDLNRLNVLVDPHDHTRIAGVIDFGDIARTARVFDLAIAAASAPVGETPAAVAIAEVVAGYHGVTPLLPAEIEMLPRLMATRIALGLTLASWHRHTQPDNPHFDLSDAAVERRLGVIAGYRAAGVAAGFARACGVVL